MYSSLSTMSLAGRVCLLLLALWGGSGLGQDGGRTTPPVVEDGGVYVSTARRFRVLGADMETRRRYGVRGEEIADAYSKLLGSTAGAGQVITVQLYNPAMVSPTKSSVLDEFTAVGQVLRLAVHVRLDDGATADAFRMAVVRCLLVADILRGRDPGEIRGGRLVPAWLEHGVAAAMAYKTDVGLDKTAAMVFSRGRAYPVEKLIQESPEKLPSAARAAWETSACGLVLTLLGMENGPARFQRLLADFGTFDADPASQIRHHFQEMAESGRAMDKWWALQVARMLRPDAATFLNATESESRLDRAMFGELPSDKATGAPPQVLSVAEILALPDAKARDSLLRGIWLGLRGLAPRVHPVFRPIADARRRLLEDVMGGKGGEVSARLAALDAESGALAARMDAIDDYLNWWEVTKGTAPVPNLDRYRAAMHPAARETPPDDPIGNYLDEVERMLPQKR